jgi:hypothetical protein
MKGITPGPIAHHTTVAHGDKMYLFGAKITKFYTNLTLIEIIGKLLNLKAKGLVIAMSTAAV